MHDFRINLGIRDFAFYGLYLTDIYNYLITMQLHVFFREKVLSFTEECLIMLQKEEM